VAREINLRIPFSTLLKVALFLLGVMMVMRLKPLLIMIVLAAFIAVVLTPFAHWLERFMRRGVAIAIVAFALFGAVIFFFVLIVPQTASQGTALLEQAPVLANRAMTAWPAGAPYIRSLLTEIQKPPKPDQVRQWLTKGMVAGRVALTAITAILFTLVLAIYFVVDGKRLLAWLISFAPPPQRRKLALTFEEVRPVATAYMRGQLTTSTLSFVAALAVLMPFQVPATMPLAVLAFVGDFIPVVGFVIALVPAVALASTVSPTAAIVVAAGYVAYQLLENYVISPRVYGRQMELSTIAVLLAITVGGALLGPIGAILILPVVASYPPIEKIWLRDRLPSDTIARHDALEEGGDEVADEIVTP
jgi:predicted PurR-regulated permease PerM